MDALVFFALLPISIIIFSLFLFKKSLLFSSFIGFIVTLFVAFLKWEFSLKYFTISFVKGFFITLDVLLIIFGALLFLGLLKKTNVLFIIESFLIQISPDRRIQAILLAWFFGGFIEGSAGFGTPAVIVAPLMVGIGFPVYTAILISLAANSTAVAFGAVGTPLRIGLSGLDTTGVAMSAGFLNLIGGLLVPFFILFFVIFENKEARIYRFFECIPWALWAGISFTLPYFLFSFFGEEFPSLLGSLVGLLIVLISLRFQFLVPKKIFYFISDNPPTQRSSATIEWRSVFIACAPYLSLVFLLLLGKLIFSRMRLPIYLYSEHIHSISLFNPGFIFLITVLLFSVVYAFSVKKLILLAQDSVRSLWRPFLSLLFLLIMVQIFLYTNQTALDGRGLLGSLTEVLPREWFSFFSVYIGVFGSFIAGSATVSNLLFGSIQAEMAVSAGFQLKWILALQLVGAGIGNMIALPNILAVQAAVGVGEGFENYFLKKLIVPCAVYASFIAVMSIFINT